MIEIGGINPQLRRDLPSPLTILPPYMPMIRHASRRTQIVPLATVALNTFEVITKKCVSRFSTGAELRRNFLLSPNSEVLLISVKDDTFVEPFWRWHSPEKLKTIAALKPLAMSAPNSSFYWDAPRPHTTRNLWRIVRSAEAIADAGIPPILHLNALGEGDWKTWETILREASSATYVCKEFQTGLSRPEHGELAILAMARMRDRLGRDLHPVVVGGAKYTALIAKHFVRFTIVDSKPFFSAAHFEILRLRGTKLLREKFRLPTSTPIDALLRFNIARYTEFIETRALIGRGHGSPRILNRRDSSRPKLISPMLSTAPAQQLSFW